MKYNQVISKKLSNNKTDEEIYFYISEHFGDIFDKYEEEVLNYLESKAIEAAENIILNRKLREIIMNLSRRIKWN